VLRRDVVILELLGMASACALPASAILQAVVTADRVRTACCPASDPSETATAFNSRTRLTIDAVNVNGSLRAG